MALRRAYGEYVQSTNRTIRLAHILHHDDELNIELQISSVDTHNAWRTNVNVFCVGAVALPIMVFTNRGLTSRLAKK